MTADEKSRPHWLERLRRALAPPLPLIANPREPAAFPLGRWNLYLGGAHRRVAGYVNVDILGVPGVDVQADALALPFADNVFTRVECNAVLEHVVDATQGMREIERVLAPGGYAHIVVPFCHPYHRYPEDYRRFTPAGLRQLAGSLEFVAEGWTTGPAATWILFTIEFAKLLLPFRWWRIAAHFTLGWVLSPLRYLDLWLLRQEHAERLGNHCYVWLRRPVR